MMIKASIIIVNYNGEKFIDGCLRSVLWGYYASHHPHDFEVIVVDNASCDKSLEIIKNFDVRLIKNKTNLGSCRARNQGANLSRGKILIFLDCDVKVSSKMVSEYVKTFEKYPDIGAIHGKLLKMDDRKTFDSSGELFDQMGFLVDRGKTDTFASIASGKAASYAIRKDLFKKLGGYDNDFFFFVEEPDLDMRVWHFGKRVVFLPTAISYHAFGTSLKDTKNYYSRYLVRYYGSRNYILMHLKNLSRERLLRILPKLVLALFTMAVLFIITGKLKDGYYMLKGIFWNVLNIKMILKKRSLVQKMNKIDDRSLDFLYINKPFSNYFVKAKSYLGNKLR